MNKRLIVKGNIIKETNYKKILQLVCKGGHLTKLDIAYTLRISIPTVTTNINELKETGIIEEVESDIYTGGRKPKVIKLIPSSRVSIGISMTKSKVVVVFMNLLNEVIITKEQDYSADHFIEYIKLGKEMAMKAREELGIDEDNILGVGISIPGTINQTIGIAEHTNMGYKDIRLTQIYDIFDHSVYIENEANLSLIAEKTINGYEEMRDLLYIGINEGLGGGVFVNGELFTGVNGRAGEFGHMQISTKLGQKPQSVEDGISTRTLIQKYNERTGDNIKSFLKFEKLIKIKDPIACQVLNEAIQTLMLLIYNLTMIFDIQKVIIGGKVGRLIKNQNISMVQMINKYQDFMYQLDLDISFSDIRNTTAMGAALLPLMDFYKINNETE